MTGKLATAAATSLLGATCLTGVAPALEGSDAQARGLGRFIKNDELVGSKKIKWTERVGARRVEIVLTVRVNYKVRIFANSATVTGFAFARSNIRLQKICLGHRWTVETGRSTGSDRPISNLEADQGGLMDYVDDPGGNNFVFVGPTTQILDGTNAGRTFTTAFPLTWTSVSKPLTDVELVIAGYASARRANCLQAQRRAVLSVG